MRTLKKIIVTVLVAFALLIGLNMQGQETEEISTALKKHTIHFSLGPGYGLTGQVREVLKQELSQNQFVGLAELHGSKQLGYFTTGLMELLREEGFRHFAMEMGPYQANALTQLSLKPDGLSENIRQTNQAYGNKLLRITPLIFANHTEDALFLEKATDSNVRLWGLDQEHQSSYEMHFDTLYAHVENKSPELTALYQESKTTVRKWIRKEVMKPKFMMSCELMWNETIDKFLQAVSIDKASKDRVKDIRTSWSIYCDSESGKGSNQQRANYMKANFDSLLSVASATEAQPKVFLKFGSVHLTKGLSPYRVDDIGKYVNEIANESQSGFLNIRHLKRYRNGKDLIGKKGWENSTNFMKQGLKDQWTLMDLRPLRALLAEGKLNCTKTEAFEIRSYDFILISPNDHSAKQNF